MDALSESQEPESDEGRDRKFEIDPALSDDGVHGPYDAMQHLMPDVHSLRDLPEGGEAGLLPVPAGPVRAEDSDEVTPLSEPGREFLIGRKMFTLQRSLCDNTWDVEIPGEGWVSTGFPKAYTAGMAEARFRNDFKGGAKKWVARRVQESGRG